MYTGGNRSGMGDGVNLFDTSTYASVLSPGGLLDTSSWDWHEWALAILGVYFVGSRIFRGGRRAKETVQKKARKVGGGFTKRRRALKTVFTG